MVNKKRDKEKTQRMIDSLRILLQSRKAHTQEAICEELTKQGFDINQSKASRILRKIGAVKITNEQGEIVYSLPKEPAPPTKKTPIKDLIIDVRMNENLILILTSPGAASMVARVLDYTHLTNEILGTLAGDDTVLVVPKSIKDLQGLFAEVKDVLIGV